MTPSDPTNFPPQGQWKADFQPDQILGGRYRVLSLLGQGGMGVVYKVEQIFLGKELALKTIGKSEQTDLILRRFETEARAVFSVSHPNIISVHDFGMLDDQTPFMAMELVDGKTLGEILKNRQLSADEAIPLFIQVCFGLAHAHESGIVHRDIKPNNIMILNNHTWGTEGSIKILDFGIAKLAQHEGGEIQALTRTGEIFGSPVYMSPEQCLGGKIDHRSDIYSLGCVLFEALTGAPPFVGENAMNTMMMHQRANVPTLKEASLGQEFPPALEQIVHRMLAKNPDQRYQNLGYAAHDLADIKRGVTGQKGSVVTVPRPVKGEATAPDMVKIRKSHFYLILLSTAAVCAILTGTTLQITHQTKPVPAVPAVQESPSQKIKERVLPDSRSQIDYDLEEKNIQDIQQGMARRRTKFSCTVWPTDKTMDVFKDYTGAQFVELTNCEVSDAGMKNLRKSKVLELTLAGDKNVRSVDEISKLKYLQNLNLRDTGITDSDIPKLAKLPMLNQLDISGCNISEKALMALTSANCLEMVSLSNKQYSKEFANQLQSKLPQCIFQPLSSQPKTTLEANACMLPNALQRYEHLRSFVSKTNPMCKFVAQNYLGMASEEAKAGRLKKAFDYAKRAESISEKTGDLKQLSTDLIVETYYPQGTKEAVALIDRVIPLDVDTTMHDDRHLFERILTAANFLRAVGQHEKVIEYCQLGERLQAQLPAKNEDYLPIFDEKIAWTYYLLKQPTRGAPYCQRNLAYWKAHQNDHPKTDLERRGQMEIPNNLYARALIEMGHSESDTQKSKVFYDEALKLLDSLNMPEDINLNEHYCDACNHMADIYAAESNSAKSLEYLRKGLAAVKQMKHVDVDNRMKFFTDKIAIKEKA